MTDTVDPGKRKSPPCSPPAGLDEAQEARHTVGMTALLKTPDPISVEEYLEGELLSDVRHEYFDGRVRAMAGTSVRHNVAAGWFYRKLATALEGGPCHVFMSDVKVRLKFLNADLFYYPDVMVACDPADRHPLYREKPKFWLEVMSADENKDRVEKFLTSRRIDSMEEYVIVSCDPDKPEVAAFRRAEGWEPGETVSSGPITFSSVGVTVSVDELYASLRGL
jgi:Uma2 family endonuclease